MNELYLLKSDHISKINTNNLIKIRIKLNNQYFQGIPSPSSPSSIVISE